MTVKHIEERDKKSHLESGDTNGMSKNDDWKNWGLLNFLIAGVSIGTGMALYRFLRSSYFKDSRLWTEFEWIFTFICICIFFGILKTIQEHFQKGSDYGKKRNDKAKDGSELPENSEKENVINELMPVPDYLKNNIGRINSLPPQILPAWNSNYDNKVFDIFPVMGNLRRKFPNKIINRADIINLFQTNQQYLGFVAAMVWGFINASMPRIKGGDRTTTNFYKALNHPQASVMNAIADAENCFIMGDCITPFNNMMSNGLHKITGVGSAYFTKIFFFLGQANNNIMTKPLIFDKWTSNAFFALLAQTHPNEVCQYFRSVKNANDPNRPGSVSLRSGQRQASAYARFVELMNYWGAQLNSSADKLEEFVFGYDLRIGNINTNPRMELWNIVNTHRTLVAG